ncbi:MAG: acyltransferase family protein [Planctomycetota bacterium]
MNTSIQPRMLDALTGLRFVAAFCVFLHHAKDRLSIESWNLGPLGGFTVGFFFVLSDFILMQIYGKTLKAGAFSRFFAACFARIWPVHAAWDGKLSGRWRATLLAPVAGWRSAPVLASVATLLFCPWIVQVSAAEERAVYAAECMQAAAPALRDIVFAEEAVIVAAHGRIEGERFSLAVIYDPLPGSRRALFTHITGADGKILRQLALRDVEFVARDGRVLRLASAEVPRSELAGGRSVGIGFWSQALGASKASRGPLSMGGHRLEVFSVP